MDRVKEKSTKRGDIETPHIIHEMDILKPDKGIHPGINYMCPKCGSKNVALREFKLHYKFYRCEDCGYSKED